MRLNRGGDRQLNRAPWSIAFSQALPPRPGAVVSPQANRGQGLAGGDPGLKLDLARVVFRLLSQPVGQVSVLDSTSASMSSGEPTPSLVVHQPTVHDLGQLTLQASQCFPRCLALSELALVVSPAGAGVHHLDPGREMEGVVERPVAVARQAVAPLLETSMGAVPE